MAIDGRRVGAFVVLAILVLTLSGSVVVAAEKPALWKDILVLPPLPPDFYTIWVPAMFLFTTIFIIFAIGAHIVMRNRQVPASYGLLLAAMFALAGTYYTYQFDTPLKDAWGLLFQAAPWGAFVAVVLAGIIIFYDVFSGGLRRIYGGMLGARYSTQTADARRAYEERVRAAELAEQQVQMQAGAARDALAAEQRARWELGPLITQLRNEAGRIEQTIQNIRRILATIRMLNYQQPGSQMAIRQVFTEALSATAILEELARFERSHVGHIATLLSDMQITDQALLRKVGTLTGATNHVRHIVALNNLNLNFNMATQTTIANKIHQAVAQLTNDTTRLRQFETQAGQGVTQSVEAVQRLRAALATGTIVELPAAEAQLNLLYNLAQQQIVRATEITQIDTRLVHDIVCVIALLNTELSNTAQIKMLLTRLGHAPAAAPGPAPDGLGGGPGHPGGGP